MTLKQGNLGSTKLFDAHSIDGVGAWKRAIELRLELSPYSSSVRVSMPDGSFRDVDFDSTVGDLVEAWEANCDGCLAHIREHVSEAIARSRKRSEKTTRRSRRA